MGKRAWTGLSIGHEIHLTPTFDHVKPQKNSLALKKLYISLKKPAEKITEVAGL